jgi:phage shock protein C
MVCPKCQKEIAVGSKFCYNCGYKFDESAVAALPPTYAPPKRFVRSSNDKKIAGVCAGVADYFDLDPTLVRVIWLLATLVPGPNILIYLILWIALPVGTTGVQVPAAGSTTAQV